MFGIYVEKDPIQNHSFGCEYTSIKKRRKRKAYYSFLLWYQRSEKFYKKHQMEINSCSEGGETRHIISIYHYFLMLQLYKLILKNTLALFKA